MARVKKLIDELKKEGTLSREKVSPNYLELVRIFPPQPIQSKKQYERALLLIEKLMTSIKSDGDKDQGVHLYLKSLGNLVSQYEENQYSLGRPFFFRYCL